ncbi:MAG: sugar porter family MFS transporter [Bacteroidales bacterium]|nr:sugar porter family MFS transporter [Bacteroidales bacterium]
MGSLNKRFIYFICAVSAMGGLLFGYDWVVIGGAKIYYEHFFGITDRPLLIGLATSIALAGCMIGALTAGSAADRYGRKPLMVLAAFIFVVSSIGTGAFNSFGGFLAARFVGGIAIGIASGLSPMYIAEAAPASIRGKLVTLNQLTIVIGILAAQIVNWRIAGTHDTLWNTESGWRWMFWATAFPAALFLILAFVIPESPRYLSMKGRHDSARSILSRIGGEEYADAELEAIKASSLQGGETSGGSLGTLFSHPFRKVLLLGIIIAFFQQWCGTNVIFNYAQEIFQGAGYDVDNTFINIVITGIANLIFTFVALFTVEKLGRRSLMLLGAGGLAGIYLILGACYFFHVKGIFMVILCVAAIACYAMTLGPITWVLISEIFPNRVRAVAVATATFFLWIGSFTLTLSFPVLNKALGTSGTFWIYTAICCAAFFYLRRSLPETKGKSLEQLENELTGE